MDKTFLEMSSSLNSHFEKSNMHFFMIGSLLFVKCLNQGFLTWGSWTSSGFMDGLHGLREDQIKMSYMYETTKYQ